MRFFLRAARSALMEASMAWLMRRASASLSSLTSRCSGVSSGGGLRTWSSGSSETGISWAAAEEGSDSQARQLIRLGTYHSEIELARRS